MVLSGAGPVRKRPAGNAAGIPTIRAATAESSRNDKCVLLTLPVCGQAAEKIGRSAVSTAPRSEPFHSGANAPIRPLFNSASIAAAISACSIPILRRKHCLRDSQDQSVSGYSMCDPTVRVYATNGNAWIEANECCFWILRAAMYCRVQGADGPRIGSATCRVWPTRHDPGSGRNNKPTYF